MRVVIDLHHSDAFWLIQAYTAGLAAGRDCVCGRGVVVGVLRVSCRPGGAGFVVELSLVGAGARRAAVAEVGFGLSAQDREDVRWYLEDYLQYPVAPAPQVAGRVQARLAELGSDLFRQVFEANRDTIRLWDAVAGSLPTTRVEVDAGIEGGQRRSARAARSGARELASGHEVWPSDARH